MAVQMEAKAILSAEDRASAVLAMVSRNFDRLAKAADAADRVHRTHEARQSAIATHIERQNTAAARAKSLAAAAVMAGARLSAPAIAAALAAKTAKAYAEQERSMTRIAITGDATRAQQEDATLSLERLADRVGLPVATVQAGLDSLVAAGRKLPEAMAFLPSVATTAQAAGAEVADIAKSADAVGASFGISAGNMQQAFDLMAAAGKEGKFELKDMARYLPSLAPAAAQMGGMKGMDGLRQMMAMLQVIRAQTGTSEEAANSFANVFSKLDSDETRNKFKKMGIDSAAALEKGRKEGRNLVEVMTELVQTATKGDLSKIPRLFQDQEVQKAMLALSARASEYKGLVAKLSDTQGTVARDFARVMQDQQTGWDRLINSAGRFARTVGGLAPVAGAMNGIADGINRISEAMTANDEAKRLLEEGGIKPVPKARTQAEVDADQAISISRFLHSPETFALPDVDDTFGRERARQRKLPATHLERVEAARRQIEESRRQEEATAIAAMVRENDARLMARVREADEIANNSGAHRGGMDASRARIRAQREAGDTDATVRQKMATHDARVVTETQRLGEVRLRQGGDESKFVGKWNEAVTLLREAVAKSEAERRRLTGDLPASSRDIDAIVNGIVSAVKAAPEKAASTGNVTAEVKPDQITAKSDVSITGGVSVRVEASSELIRAYTTAQQIMASGGNRPPVNLGQSNP